MVCWDFVWDSIESIDKVGKNWHLIHDYRVCLCLLRCLLSQSFSLPYTDLIHILLYLYLIFPRLVLLQMVFIFYISNYSCSIYQFLAIRLSQAFFSRYLSSSSESYLVFLVFLRAFFFLMKSTEFCKIFFSVSINMIWLFFFRLTF